LAPGSVNGGGRVCYDRGMSSRRRPLLEQLTQAPLAKPCDVPWDAMRGGERVRVCDACEREVWNLSAMTAREAEIRLLNAAGVPCINYRVDGEGALISRAELRAPPRRFGLGAAAFVASTLVAPGAGSLAGSVASAQEAAKAPAAPKPLPKPSTEAPAARTKLDECPQSATAFGGATALNPTQHEPLGGAPPPPRDLPPAGTVQLKSAAARDVTIDGITFRAPGTIRLPPGKHEALIKNAGKTVKRSFDVKLDGTFVLDLDR
jgi:hypothetical protein